MNIVEIGGQKVIIDHLQSLGHAVSRTTGTFDLSVDGSDAEIKAKGKPFANLDFIAYTKNQYDAIKTGMNFDTYLICGVSTGTPEAYRLPSSSLLSVDKEMKAYTSYSYNKGSLQPLTIL